MWWATIDKNTGMQLPIRNKNNFIIDSKLLDNTMTKNNTRPTNTVL